MVLLAHVHGHLGQLLPVLRVLHVRHLFAQVLLLGDALFAHGHVGLMMHGLVMLRMLRVLRVVFVAVVGCSMYTGQGCHVEKRQDERGGEGRKGHGRSLGVAV